MVDDIRPEPVGALAAGVGHDLRNLAQIQIAVVGELEGALAAGEDVAAVVRELLPDLRRVVDQLAVRGAQLLELATPAPTKLAPVELTAVVREVVELARGAGKLAGLELDVVCSPAPVRVTADRARLERTVAELVLAAADTLRTARPRERRLTIMVRGDDDGTSCKIGDTATLWFEPPRR